MAAKKGRESKGRDQRQDVKAVLRLSRHAQAEVAKLLKRDQSGTITRIDLETGLEEVEERLKAMILFMHKLL
jgi:hypothetical protein